MFLRSRRSNGRFVGITMGQKSRKPTTLFSLGIKTGSKVCYGVLFPNQHLSQHLSF